MEVRLSFSLAVVQIVVSDRVKGSPPVMRLLRLRGELTLKLLLLLLLCLLSVAEITRRRLLEESGDVHSQRPEATSCRRTLATETRTARRTRTKAGVVVGEREKDTNCDGKHPELRYRSKRRSGSKPDVIPTWRAPPLVSRPFKLSHGQTQWRRRMRKISFENMSQSLLRVLFSNWNPRDWMTCLRIHLCT